MSEQSHDARDRTSAPRSATGKPRRRASSTRPVRRRTDPTPDPMGGRFWTAAILLALMVIFPWGPLTKAFDGIVEKVAKRQTIGNTDVSRWKIGATEMVRVSVVTADYDLLECAAQQEFESVHCEHKSPEERWQRDPNAPLDDNKSKIIQPYRTWPDNKLVALAGLWADPRVAMRLHIEPPAGIPSNKLARFVAECKTRFVGKFDNPNLRWYSGQPWQPAQEQVMVGKVESCEIMDEQP
jgi:hypothetical protein